MQTQDKAKRTHAKHTEGVEMFMQTTSCALPQRRTIQTKLMQRKCELTELSNVNICIMGNLSLHAESSCKTHMK